MKDGVLLMYSELVDEFIAAAFFESEGENAASVANFEIDLWTCIPTTT